MYILSQTKKCIGWTSLVVQWVSICLPMQGTEAHSLVWEDSPCSRATKSIHNYWAHRLHLPKPAHLEPVLCSKRSQSNEKPKQPPLPQLEKALAKQWRSSAAKKWKRTTWDWLLYLLPSKIPPKLKKKKKTFRYRETSRRDEFIELDLPIIEKPNITMTLHATSLQEMQRLPIQGW